MIKVVHIVNLITGKSDGVYKHLKTIFELSSREKFEHILIFHGNEKIERELKQIQIPVFTVNSLNKKFSLKSFTEIFRILKEINPDIIHTHLIKPYAIAGLLNIFIRKPFIFNYHGIFISGNSYYVFLEKIIYRIIHLLISLFGKVDAVLVPSEKSRQILHSETKLFPQPVVYYNGYYSKNSPVPDQELLEAIKAAKLQAPVVAAVGRLEREKRIDSAILIAVEMKSRGYSFKLFIFGNGILKEQLQNLVSLSNINDSVVFLDYIPDAEIYFSFSDLILFTSASEGMPLTLWEAMANKVPVLAPDVGGFREILEGNNCGLVYEPGNMNDAIEKLTVLLKDKNLREKLGQNGKSAIELIYNQKNFITKIENVYLALVK